MVIVHRIIEIKEEDGKTMYQTKGDNNNIADNDLVDSSQIEGVYQFRIPKIGNVFMFIYKNIIIVIVIVILLIIIFKLIKRLI